jgi:DNA-binding XRE family transcriptional regulator
MAYGERMTTTSITGGVPGLVAVLRARKKSRDLPERGRRRTIREAAGASREEVAAAVGVSAYAVYCWEKLDGRIEPSDVNRASYKRVLTELERLANEFEANHPQK